MKRFLLIFLIASCGSDALFTPEVAEAVEFQDEYVYPQQAHLVIDAPLNRSVVVRKGPQATFSRGSTAYYYDGRLQRKLSGVPVTKAVIRGQLDTMHGYQSWGARRNILTYSEELTKENVWTATGGMSVSNVPAVTDPSGGTATYLLDGTTSTSALSNESGFAAASYAYMCAVYLRAVSGTVDVTVRIRDNGDTEQGVVTVRATTNWYRTPTVYHKFSSSASGNAVFEIETGNADVYATMAQCHRPDETWRTGSFEELGPYIKTTNTDSYSYTDDLRFDGTTVDSTRTHGTACLWIKAPFDGNIIGPGGARNLWSQGGENFSLQTNENFYMSLYVNGSYLTGTDVTGAPDYNAWSHICAIWQTDPSHSYKIYKNGRQVASTTSALGPWTAAGNAFYLGNHSTKDTGVSVNSLMRQFAMWDTVLTPTEIATIYADQAPSYAFTVDTGKIFEVDLGTSLWPTTCTTCGYRYHSADNIPTQTPYWSGPTTYSVTKPGVPSIGYPYNNSSRKGLQFAPTNRNFILYSEDPANAAWTAVGAPVVTSDVGRFFGSAPDGMSYGTIAGTSGEGIKQSVAQTPHPGPTSDSWIASVYVATASGTLDGVLKIRATGGDPEEATQSFTATTTPQRVFIRKAFTAAATTGVEMEVVLSASGTLRVSGMMLEDRYVSFEYSQGDWGPGIYFKSTSATKVQRENCLYYDMAGNINMAKGTAIMWLAFELGSTLQKDSDGEGIWSFMSTGAGFGAAGVSERVSQYYGGTTVNTPSLTYTGNTWTQLGFTWNQATGAFKLYQDGTLKASSTSLGLPTPQMSQMEIGCGGPGHRGDDAFKGVAGRYAIWGTDDVSLIENDWNSYKASYGR